MISRTHIIHRCDSFNERYGGRGLSEGKLMDKATVHRDNGCSLEGRGRPNRQELLTNSYWEEEHRNRDGKKRATDVQTNKNYWKGYSKSPEHKFNDVYSHVGPSLLSKLDQRPEDDGTLRLYRGMSRKEADDIMDWRSRKDMAESHVRNRPDGYDANQFRKDSYVLPVSGHLGGYDQAKEYAKFEGNTMMEFKFKPGAHKHLFDPESMALAPSGKGAGRALNELYGPYPTGSKNEGLLGGYVGLKPESKGDFSMAIGDKDASRLNFQLMLDDVRRSPAPPSRYGTPYSSSPASTSGFPPNYDDRY